MKSNGYMIIQRRVVVKPPGRATWIEHTEPRIVCVSDDMDEGADEWVRILNKIEPAKPYDMKQIMYELVIVDGCYSHRRVREWYMGKA